MYGCPKGFEQEVLLARRVFTNKDGSTATLNLVSSKLTQSGGEVCAIYQKRWKVEVTPSTLRNIS